MTVFLEAIFFRVGFKIFRKSNHSKNRFVPQSGQVFNCKPPQLRKTIKIIFIILTGRGKSKLFGLIFFDLFTLGEPFSELDDRAEKAIHTRLQALAKAEKMILLTVYNKAGLSFCNKMLLPDGE